MKKKILVVAAVIIFMGVLFVLNMFFGNPISKMKVEKETVKFFKDTYNEEFVVYDSQYNPLIPAYVFELGPMNSKDIKFNTGLYVQGITDEYGGILASLKLSQDVGSILKAEYQELNLDIIAMEDPLVSYAGETADYFEKNPKERVLKNHYNLVVLVEDGRASQAELDNKAINMVKKIESELPYKTPNLKVYIQFKSEELFKEAETKEEGMKFFWLFPTVG
ncbi:MAG: hypothetical protein WBI17_00300 [Clostridiaceae bacterium]